jgi:Transposase DDE domain group 1
MTDDTIPLFSFPAIQGKKVTAGFDGGRLSSDGGVMLLSMAERLARCIPDRRDPSRIAHTIADMIRARVFAICCGYEDADDLDVLRCDPAFKLACGRLPDSGRDLCSQPTLSRLENAPGLKDVIRLTYALVDQWMASYGLKRLIDLPLAWPDQWRTPGLEAPAQIRVDHWCSTGARQS